MKQYVAYQSKEIFVFKIPGILTDKRRTIFERYLEENGIKNYYLHSITEHHSVSFPEVTGICFAYNFRTLVDWAKLIQLVDNDEEGPDDSADIGDIVDRAVKSEASALERMGTPKKMFAGRRVN